MSLSSDADPHPDPEFSPARQPGLRGRGLNALTALQPPSKFRHSLENSMTIASARAPSDSPSDDRDDAARPDDRSPGPGAGRGAELEVKGLAKEYLHGGRIVSVLRRVDLSLQPGDMAAIVGASGVGKSTLLHVLGTLDLPTSGSIRFNDEELTRMVPSRLAEFRNREIGFVFQFHHLLPEFTALENVMMPAMIQRIPRAEAKRRAREILENVGLGKRLTHRPSELSGGEQQRVALARAMVMQPSLLLADEPTGNLDRRTGEEIHRLFLELNQAHGSTLLVVTHNPELAAMMPRCLRMLDGGGLEEVHDHRRAAESASHVTTPPTNQPIPFDPDRPVPVETGAPAGELAPDPAPDPVPDPAPDHDAPGDSTARGPEPRDEQLDPDHDRGDDDRRHVPDDGDLS